MRHFLTLLDLNADEIRCLFKEAAHLKACRERRIPTPILAGRTLALIFEKPSLRTRLSFQAAVAQLGGASIFLAGQEVGFGSRESLSDAARTTSLYVDGVVLRTFSQQTIEDFALHSTCPVVNGLSDQFHPCQALADIFTVQELFGELTDRTVVFVGDGNNVARSLALCCGQLGLRFILASPKQHQFDKEFVRFYHRQGFEGQLEQTEIAKEAVARADVIYTDVWASMGQEAERDERSRMLGPYQVNDALLKKAPKHACVMHCLPAHRGEEITDDVLDGDRSVVFQQAANRLHVQKALLPWLLSS